MIKLPNSADPPIFEKSIEADCRNVEQGLRERGATRFASLWWSDPHVMGVLEDGRVVAFNVEYHPHQVSFLNPDAPILNPERVLYEEQPQVRDLDTWCAGFRPGTPQGRGSCLGDGYYSLCRECEVWAPELRGLCCPNCGLDFEWPEHKDGQCPRCQTPFTWQSSQGHDQVELGGHVWRQLNR